jgi:hypothetical protein
MRAPRTCGRGNKTAAESPRRLVCAVDVAGLVFDGREPQVALIGESPGAGDAPEGEDHELDRSYRCRNLRWHGSYGLSDSRNVARAGASPNQWSAGILAEYAPSQHLRIDVKEGGFRAALFAKQTRPRQASALTGEGVAAVESDGALLDPIHAELEVDRDADENFLERSHICRSKLQHLIGVEVRRDKG